MSHLVVREAVPSDAEAVATLWREVGEHLVSLDPEVFQVPVHDGCADFFRSLLEREDPDSRRLVVEVGDVVAGLGMAHLEQAVDSAPFQLQRRLSSTSVHVDVVAVAAAHRRTGVGRLLMSELGSWGRGRGARHVVLDTFAASPLSIPFYRSLGFAEQAVVLHKPLG
jgi:GNAT superfamily N-acetyltransferase